jgi:hypothetical protein
MATKDALKDFVEQVRKSTEDGRIPWEDGPAENNFIAPMGEGSLRIFIWWDEEGGCNEYALSILNDEGKLADQVSTDSGGDLDALQAILEGARRKARNADEIMRRMLEDMK